ncbi:chemotaxis protein CheW [Oceanisphaera sp. W20_SRM_FM3]|uniref:chemotaxis protein CheW n=1 Tax=Oceanisphaera sp. W20_SRM_FM3 TaxID=3240267 RepID=UPI003F9CFCD8
MKQPYADVLNDYFGALLEESPPLEHELAPALEPAPLAKAEPTPAPMAPYAEPDAAARRVALEALLAQVAALKEEETTVLATETLAATEPEAEPQTAVEPEPVVIAAAVVVPVVAPTTVTPTIAAPMAAPMAEPVVAEQVASAIDLELQAQLAAQQVQADQAAAWRNMETEHSFQVLFFEVAGMTFAVPLTHLGGIYQVAKLTSLFGKPHWFAGVQTERDRQIYAVDTARWAMPGHTAEEEYGYLVTLGESNWGLGCHQLKGTALLTRDQVKWRATPGARPWLAGMVKERMCALLHVDALIALLEQGKNIDGQQV